MPDFKQKFVSLAKKRDLTPLRYPGGKRKLAPLVADIFLRKDHALDLFVEPFCGGASMSLAMLESGLAKEVALSDIDIGIASFWQVVFSKDATALADKIASTPVTLENWKCLKFSEPKDKLEQAFRCIFLNRTSFSGILHQAAGPIGGMAQKSKYSIDCRFNTELIARRIIELSGLRSRVRFIRLQSYKKTISDIKRTGAARNNSEGILWYLDPPFFEKANKLYNHCFESKEHGELRQILFEEGLPGNWILSYDDVEAARHEYSSHKGFCRVNLSYNARVDKRERLVSSEIIVSNIIADIRSKSPSLIPSMGQVIPLFGLDLQTENFLKERVI